MSPFRALAVALLVALGVAGCSTIERYNPFSSAPKVTMAELESIQPSATLELRWRAAVGSAKRHIFSPAVAGDSVFAAAADGTLARYDGGKEAWRVSAGQTLSSGVGSNGVVVVVGTPKGEVLAFDANGQALWNTRVSSEVLAAPAVGQGVVIVRSGDNRVFALDLLDGRRRWVYQRATPALTLRNMSGVVLHERGVLAGFPGGKLVLIDPKNGAAIWEATVALPHGATELERIADVSSPPVVAGREVCAAAFQGRVGCFDLITGNPLWSRELSSSAGISIDGGRLYLTDDKGAVHALDRGTGTSLWRNDKLFLRSVTRPLPVGEHLAVGDAKGVVHLLNQTDGGFAARFNTDGSPIDLGPVLAGDGFVVQTRDGSLFSLAAR